MTLHLFAQPMHANPCLLTIISIQFHCMPPLSKETFKIKQNKTRILVLLLKKGQGTTITIGDQKKNDWYVDPCHC